MIVNSLNIDSDGIQDFNSTTGNFDATDLSTKGDLLGYTGSEYQRFPVGSDGYVLKADSTMDTGWRWACPAFELIQTQTASNSSSIDFTSFADSDCYSGYRICYQQLNRNAANISLRLRVSVDNGSTWLSSNYKYFRESIITSGSRQLPSSASSGHIELNQTSGGPVQCVYSGELLFFASPDPSGGLKQGFLQMSSYYASQLLTSRGSSLNTTTSQINGFRFYISSGNIVSGKITLWGILK